MILNEEIYFEITFSGEKTELKKMLSFLKSGELDDFFEFSSEYISYDDDYTNPSETKGEMYLSTEDYGIEIDEFDTDEFLEILCKAGKNLDVFGQIYDISDEEFRFSSQAGDSYYVNSNKVQKFNDELDAAAEDEESEEMD